ncbi:DUF1206 domain-containing protein [Thalassococcus sp. BH17M4-6]|uniref:DUF1206 domain-containing protein n=1 Tax=Thalassococcus sp. BH17M4-6 TaxID=3413148 RepID=UPI003BE4BE5C
MADKALDWAVPVMRAGYSGRGLTYVVIAGLSLWAIWLGGEAKGTSSALESLRGEPGGYFVLGLIAIGLMAYCIWRVIDAIFDLEDYGTDGEGIIARLGMVVTGLIHGALAIVALLLFMGDSGGGGGGIPGAISTVLSWPMGQYIVGAAGIVTVGAGLYYLRKAHKESYRSSLRANHFTVNWNWVLKAGVAAQGVIVTIVGGFLVWSAVTYSPDKAGGLGDVFRFLKQQPFGQTLVVLICLGLLGFALFCFVNAAYRIIPKVADPDVETLARRLKAKAKSG